MKNDIMNDLQAVDNYIEKCLEFVNPVLLRDITDRGLYNVINYLPRNIKEAKAVARARLAKMGKCFGDPEIDQIANTVQRIEHLREKLNALSMTDCNKVLEIVDEIKVHSEFIRDYFKENEFLKSL